MTWTYTLSLANGEIVDRTSSLEFPLKAEVYDAVTTQRAIVLRRDPLDQWGEEQLGVVLDETGIIRSL